MRLFHMNHMILYKFSCILIAMYVLFSSVTFADKPRDQDALLEVKEGKVVWDVTVGSPSKLLLMLNVIEETYDELTRQNVQPEMVFASHGPVVKLITTESLDLPLDEEVVHKQALEQLMIISKKTGRENGVLFHRNKTNGC